MSHATPASAIHVLVVDDEPGLAENMAEALERMGLRCMHTQDPREALRMLNEHEFDLVVTDLVMRDVTGFDVLAAAKQRHPDCEVIVVSGQGGVESAVEAMQKGAATYVRKPVRIEELRAFAQKQIDKIALRRRTEDLERRVDENYGAQGIIARSPQLRAVLQLVRQVADTNATVLVLGESGTGKEVIAQAVHRLGRRRNGPFVAINCAAMTESLLESELFGHERGAFTGAVRSHRGKFEYAEGGTLFLDEIGDMPLSLQAKLLRVLETREVVRVGGNSPTKVDVRIVAATNQDLDQAVRDGRFREDLLFRIKVVPIRIPPLRERREDIPALVEKFMKEFADLHGRPIRGVTSAAMARIIAYPWPGNVRQLRNAIETAVLVAPGSWIDTPGLPPEVQGALTETSSAGAEPPPSSSSAATSSAAASSPHAATSHAPVPDALSTANGDGAPSAPEQRLEGLVMNLEDVERILIRNALRQTGGNREQAARLLGISERTLYRKIKQWGTQVSP
ncbi:MAG: DNA-binding transcriptional regulator NtrC [Planctomycetes bacterium]|nr:DNA-binding transcriptional regulator NtrC [Planctomycetota bacterium]